MWKLLAPSELRDNGFSLERKALEIELAGLILKIVCLYDVVFSDVTDCDDFQRVSKSLFILRGKSDIRFHVSRMLIILLSIYVYRPIHWKAIATHHHAMNMKDSSLYFLLFLFYAGGSPKLWIIEIVEIRKF